MSLKCCAMIDSPENCFILGVPPLVRQQQFVLAVLQIHIQFRSIILRWRQLNQCTPRFNFRHLKQNPRKKIPVQVRQKCQYDGDKHIHNTITVLQKYRKRSSQIQSSGYWVHWQTEKKQQLSLMLLGFCFSGISLIHVNSLVETLPQVGACWRHDTGHMIVLIPYLRQGHVGDMTLVT